MKIEKHCCLKSARYVCKFCGCVFTAEVGEYVLKYRLGDLYAACDCPECGQTCEQVYKGDNVEIFDMRIDND